MPVAGVAQLQALRPPAVVPIAHRKAFDAIFRHTQPTTSLRVAEPDLIVANVVHLEALPLPFRIEGVTLCGRGRAALVVHAEPAVLGWVVQRDRAVNQTPLRVNELDAKALPVARIAWHVTGALPHRRRAAFGRDRHAAVRATQKRKQSCHLSSKRKPTNLS